MSRNQADDVGVATSTGVDGEGVSDERRAFEALLDTEAHDEVGRVVDMYFRRPTLGGEGSVDLGIRG